MADAHRLRIGLGVHDLDALPQRARQAETMGFDYVFSGEHIFFHGPVPNAFVALGAAAGATAHIELLSAITLLPLYPPVLAAKMAAVLDRVSAGRFHLGVGVGGEFRQEFTATGVPLDERGARTDEALQILRLLFAPGRHTFRGRWTTFHDVALDPPPRRPGGPPIWVAGRSAAAMRRAGRYADVWMPYLYTPEQLAESLAAVRSSAAEAGRDPSVVGAAVYAFVCVDEDGTAARAAAIEAVSRNYRQDFRRLQRYLIAGTPDECARRIREYAEAGAEAVQLQIACAPADEGRVSGLLARAVLPQLRAVMS